METIPAQSPEIVEKKLSIMRRYISEILIVVLASCVLYLFRSQAALNQNIIDYYKTDKAHDMEQIQNSRSVIETNNTILRDIRVILREATHINVDTSKMF